MNFRNNKIKESRIIVVFLLSFFLSVSLISQTFGHQAKFPQSLLNEKSVYIVCRGTDSKMKKLNDIFNLNDPCITHIGIGLIENGELVIYSMDISPNKYGSYLKKKNLNEYINENGIFYLSIWENAVQIDQLQRMKHMLEVAFTTHISFDWDFSLSNDAFYCSEFVYKILKQTNFKNFSFHHYTIQLPKFFQSVTGKRCLTYIPLDFFQVGEKYKKIYERFY